MATAMLELTDLTKVYHSGTIKKSSTVALDKFRMTLSAEAPKITTIAGESGSGKTTLVRLILGFLTPTRGRIAYEGTDIWEMTRKEWLEYRRNVQAIFQDPYEVYNPFYRVDHVFDMLMGTFNLARTRKERRALVEAALAAVGLRSTEILGKHPHQLSGGQRQRLMVARAFLLRPRLIVADEAVSMIDVSLRGMILEIMMQMKEQQRISFLYVTHDLSTAYQISDEIFILYRGGVAESGSIDKVIHNPRHPYTQTLIASIPVPDPDVEWGEQLVLPTMQESSAPKSEACKFYDRCIYRFDKCLQSEPELVEVEENHHVACFLQQATVQDPQPLRRTPL